MDRYQAFQRCKSMNEATVPFVVNFHTTTASFSLQTSDISFAILLVVAIGESPYRLDCEARYPQIATS
jgi:hypothetical protein